MSAWPEIVPADWVLRGIRRVFGQAFGPSVHPRQADLSRRELLRHRAFAVVELADAIALAEHPDKRCDYDSCDGRCYGVAARLHFQRWLWETGRLADEASGDLAAVAS